MLWSWEIGKFQMKIEETLTKDATENTSHKFNSQICWQKMFGPMWHIVHFIVCVSVCMCACLCVSHHLHTSESSLQQPIKWPSLRTRRTPTTNVGRGGSAESTHCCIVLVEKCDDRRDLSCWTGVWGSVFNERKMKPGSWICMKGLETNHEAQWALEKSESPCCS